MSPVKRGIAAAGCAFLLWFLPVSGQERVLSTKELIAELTGMSGVDRGLRVEQRPPIGKIERGPSRDQPYVPGKVLVRWPSSGEPLERDLTREGIAIQRIEHPDYADFAVLRTAADVNPEEVARRLSLRADCGYW